MRHLVEEIKRVISPVDIDNLIHSLSGAKGQDNDEYSTYLTICHCGSSMKLYYYKKSKSFYCYSNCGSMSIFSFVMQVLDIDFKQSVSYIAKLLGIENKLAPVGFGKLPSWKYEEVEEEEVEVTLPVINKNTLDLFIDYHCHEWLRENISHETMSKYGIRYFLDQHKIVIPHFNMDGELVGIRGRALLQADLDRGQKYMPIFIGKKGYAHSLIHNLYGLNFNLDAIKSTGKVIIFEGEKSVLMMDSVYGDGNCSVAVCGSKVHKAHARILEDLGVTECILAFDKQYMDEFEEELWKKKINKSIELLSKFCTVSVIWDDIKGVLDYKDAPIDKGREVFEYLLKNREIIQ